MSRIDQESHQVKWNQVQKSDSREHPDYKKNFETASNFIIKIKKHLLKGMDVKICDSENIPKALLIISWSPGATIKKGNYATPIFLHQYNDDFKKTTENVFSFYMKSVEHFQGKNAEQTDFIDSNLKV